MRVSAGLVGPLACAAPIAADLDWALGSAITRIDDARPGALKISLLPKSVIFRAIMAFPAGPSPRRRESVRPPPFAGCTFL